MWAQCRDSELCVATTGLQRVERGRTSCLELNLSDSNVAALPVWLSTDRNVRAGEDGRVNYGESRQPLSIIATAQW